MRTKEVEDLKAKYGIVQHGGGQWGVGFLEGLRTADRFNVKGLKILYNWLNRWADCEKHPEHSIGGKRTPYGNGYQDAVRDIIARVDVLLNQGKDPLDEIFVKKHKNPAAAKGKEGK